MAIVTASNSDLDAQVLHLRRILDDPNRISCVSGSAFPLRVWERMFAQDRDRRAGAADQQLLLHEQQQQQGGDLNSESGGDQQSQQFDLTSSRDFSDTTNSRHSRQHGNQYQQRLEQTKRQMRVCRSGAMSSTVMRDLVKSTVLMNSNRPAAAPDMEGEAALTASSPSSRGDSPLPQHIARNNNNNNNNDSDTQLRSSSSKSRRSSPSPAEPTLKSAPLIPGAPVAVLSCVTVPPRHSASTGQAGNMSNNKSPQSLFDRQQQQQYRARQRGDVVSLALLARAASEDAASLRSQPVRPFSPVSSMWTAEAGLHSGAGGRRAAVERHDLPFDVTPANDFRQLPYALTGLGHRVPYAELQDELIGMLDHTDKLAAQYEKVNKR